MGGRKKASKGGEDIINSADLQIKSMLVVKDCLTLWLSNSLFYAMLVLVTHYILVQKSTTVSWAGLPVLRTLYKPISMHKSTNSRNCESCVL